MEIITVNWWAIIVAAIASMVIGSIWYGPLFGKKWQEVMGVQYDNKSPEEQKAMRKGMGMLYGAQFVLSILTIWILAHYTAIVKLTTIGMTSTSVGIQNALWVWLGFIMPTVAGAAMWSGKSKRLSWNMFLISAGYNIVLFAVFGLILGAWN
jgi:hypothetical protein